MPPCESIRAIMDGRAEEHFFEVLENDMQIESMMNYFQTHREEMFGHIYEKNENKPDEPLA